MLPDDDDRLLSELDSQIRKGAEARRLGEDLLQRIEGFSQATRERLRRLLERYGSVWTVGEKGGATRRPHGDSS